MKINRLVIENFKSIERIELIEPNPFTVFVGPNGSGKSNIFEALEFVNSLSKNVEGKAVREFGGIDKIQNRKKYDSSLDFTFHVEFEDSNVSISIGLNSDLKWYLEGKRYINPEIQISNKTMSSNSGRQFFGEFTRIFIGKDKEPKFYYQDDSSLNFAATNLEQVLKRILSDEVLKGEIFEWLELFVPGFKAVEIDERNELHWFEEFAPGYFTKDLISDGTYNILALLTAVYQSDDKPQFLCIEEPENGLNPKVTKELVNLCRYACEEFGHFIWLNTHSQSLVSVLEPNEIILVDKIDGATNVKQIKDINLHGLPMDEAWLSNALGGGLPW